MAPFVPARAHADRLDARVCPPAVVRSPWSTRYLVVSRVADGKAVEQERAGCAWNWLTRRYSLSAPIEVGEWGADRYSSRMTIACAVGQGV